MVLLLTGAIDIRNQKTPSTALTDLSVRLSQYLFSINYAIENYRHISAIVFCENTNYYHDYSALKLKAEEYGKQLEILSFAGDYSQITEKGKGFGEGESIAYALQNSELLKNSRAFFKLTGRLYLRNMDQLVGSAKADNCFNLHPRSIYQMPVDHVETFFYKVNKDLYNSLLLNTYQEVDEPNYRYLEHLFYEKLADQPIRAFKHPLQLTGLSGTSGNSYMGDGKAILMEKISCFLGVHNLRKTPVEKLSTHLFSFILRINKLRKLF